MIVLDSLIRLLLHNCRFINSELSWSEFGCDLLNSTELADETSADPICMDIELGGAAAFRLVDEGSFSCDGVVSWGLLGAGGAAQTGITDLILTAGAILCGLNPPVYMFWAIVGAMTEVGAI